MELCSSYFCGIFNFAYPYVKDCRWRELRVNERRLIWWAMDRNYLLVRNVSVPTFLVNSRNAYPNNRLLYSLSNDSKLQVEVNFISRFMKTQIGYRSVEWSLLYDQYQVLICTHFMLCGKFLFDRYAGNHLLAVELLIKLEWERILKNYQVAKLDRCKLYCLGGLLWSYVIGSKASVAVGFHIGREISASAQYYINKMFSSLEWVCTMSDKNGTEADINIRVMKTDGNEVGNVCRLTFAIWFHTLFGNYFKTTQNCHLNRLLRNGWRWSETRAIRGPENTIAMSGRDDRMFGSSSRWSLRHSTVFPWSCFFRLWHYHLTRRPNAR